MADTILYKTTGLTFYARIVRKSDSFIWNETTSVFAADTSWANSKITITEDPSTGQYPVEVPSALPTGQYDLVIYKNTTNSVSDVVEIGFPLTQGSIFGF